MPERRWEQWEARARDVLPEPTADFIAAGAGSESSLAGNLDAWRGLDLVPRVLRGVAEVSTRLRIGDDEIAAPILLAPAGRQRALHPEGELAVARAAREFGTITTLATSATADLHDVAGTGAMVWQQLYVSTDRDWTSAVIAEAARAGIRQIVVTVDRPREAHRPRSARHGGMGTLPDGVAVTSHRGDGSTRSSEPGVWDAALEWGDIARIVGESKIPVAVKGILHPDDARRALDAGVAGIVVSNHGGRQLDGVVPTARVLPGIVAAVDGAVPVDVDGGIRTGGDVFRALALGARAVLIGRQYLWALAAAGQPGVESVLDTMTRELAEVMALCGAASPADITPGHVALTR